MSAPERQRRAVQRTALIAGAVFVAMIGATFAAVPLYGMFCRVTGYGGTTQKAVAAPKQILDQTVEVRFDTNVAPGSPLAFAPDERTRIVRLGETSLVFFKVTNPSDRPVSATATYNVTPDQAGLFFKKLECFCFQKRTFAPGETIELPVVFFVDPAMAEDADAKHFSQIALSYTYFDAGAPAVQTVTAIAPEGVGRVVATP